MTSKRYVLTIFWDDEATPIEHITCGSAQEAETLAETREREFRAQGVKGWNTVVGVHPDDSTLGPLHNRPS